MPMGGISRFSLLTGDADRLVRLSDTERWWCEDTGTKLGWRFV